MGLFDAFKSEPPKLSPRLALAVGLLFMMSADGEIESEEIGQLQSVVGGDGDLIQSAIKYLRSTKYEQFLSDASVLLNSQQKLSVLINMADSLLSDGHVISGSTGATSSVSISGRVGGDPTNWNVAGTSASIPASAKMQVGVVNIVWPGSVLFTSSSVVFPVSFGGYPIISVTRLSSGNSGGIPTGEATSISNNSFVCYVNSGTSLGNAPSNGTTCQMSWIAIGPP